MSDYSKLVKALRIRSGNLCPGDICDRCEAIHFLCSDKVMHDAAAAIEALQAEVKRLNMRCADCEYGNSEWPEDPEHTKLPKRGEWIIHGEPPMLVIECSVCGQKYFNHVMQEKAKYCSMCGAKMEVRE